MDENQRWGEAGVRPSAEAERTSRQRALPWIGDIGQRRLRDARVLIIGAGGIAAPAVQYLAGAGVGRLDLLDDDVIETSNLARQLLFTQADVGRPKAATLAAAAARLAPATRVEAHDVRLTAANTVEIIRVLAPDVVVDTTDDWATRFAIADACAECGVPLVWPSVIGTDAKLTVFTGRAGDPAIDDLVDRETVQRHPVSCAAQGVLGPVVGQVGAMAATEAIKLLVGAGRPLVGRVAVIDGLGATMREIPLVARRAAASVAEPGESAARPGDAGEAAGRRGPEWVRRARPAAGPSSTEQWGAWSPPRTGSVTRPIPLPSRAAAGELRSRLTTIGEMVAAPLGTVLVDVREPSAPALPWPPRGLELVELERAPLESLASAIDAGELPGSIERATRVVVACAFGPRARHAAAMLRAAGVPGVAVLDEGTAGLRTAGSDAPAAPTGGAVPRG
ncbi:HesA/MoeB/ThiF family protein [Pseudoclavibacter endophyticus]|uniref:HesA/MoeB/ThiF family protein n=1 Tax=Pseudoclavibacter endophyticus TaxID=1778590 RepID=UPI0016696902|nr:HesA/MoeB/ThiF family protein [Pseudoclavibacter endophyticus]